MTPPKVSATIFFILAMIDQYAVNIPDQNIATLVRSACRLGEAVTVYLVAKGVILGLRKA